jgi:hypothetical protein
VKHSRLKYWATCLPPVIFVVFDAKNDQCYWTYIKKKNLIRNEKIVEVDMNYDFGRLGTKRLYESVVGRFEELKSQEDGAKVVIDALKKMLKLDISYEPDGGLLMIPRGKFIPDPSGDSQAFFFGPLGALIERGSREFGISPQKLVIDGLENFFKLIDSFKRGGELVIRDKKGSLIREFSTYDEYHRYEEEMRLLGRDD